MSDDIKHECGLAFIRLRKPFSYYLQKYGSVTYGLNKLYLLMEKQHNRGQDGAGIAAVKLNIEAGNPYLHRMRSSAPQPIADLFYSIGQEIQELEKHQPDIKNHPGLMKGHLPFLGELLLGHLRYGTQGKNNVEFCHPFIKRNISPGKNLALAGNFNLVNTDDLFTQINFEPGAFQKQSDLAAMMEVVHHFLVQEDDKNPNAANIESVLKHATPMFDGGYTIGGLLGNGGSFIMRDAHGIRPAYYYISDDVIVAASEIYFSRGSDEKIYRERIALGRSLSETVLERINHDLKNTIFSYIPNTAEVAFYGLVKGMEAYLNKIKVERILSWGKDFTPEKLEEMVNRKIRQEKIAIKDVKLRTFITEDANRNEMVQHVYDITYGTVRSGEDTLVVIDDSIVRGTTLKESIVRMLSRLNPKKIIVVSSAPQIRYPDCYGIDMSKLGDFIAFKAAVALLKDTNQEHILTEVHEKIKALDAAGELHTENVVRNIYKPFTTAQISDKIAALITPPEVSTPVEVIYQTIEDLHTCCPTNTGDWYFTGNYPTPGGNKVVNKAFLNYIEGKNERGY